MAHTPSQAKVTALFGDPIKTAPAGQGVSISQTSPSFLYRIARSEGRRAIFDDVWATPKGEWQFCTICKVRSYIIEDTLTGPYQRRSAGTGAT
jgi:hypothetical protein